MLAALTGMLLGTWHVVSGPDHLAALAPLAARRAHSPSASARIGLAWGLGHAGAVWLVGLILLALGDAVALDGLGLWSERLVGLVLIGVGIWGVCRDQHEHDSGHEHEHEHEHELELRLGSSALGIGLIHGLAGASHLYGVLPAFALEGAERLSYLGGFGIASIFAMAAFAALFGLVVSRAPGSEARIRQRVSKGASWVAIVVGLAWLIASA